MSTQSDFFNWDDEITSNGSNFVTLMPGTYEGIVTGIEKGRWPHPGKMFNCSYAKISISVSDDGNGNSALVTDHLFLARKAEFRIAMFLMALGLKKKDENIRADRIEKALNQNVKIVVACQRENEKNYLSAEEATHALENGETVYNRIKRYEPSDKQPVGNDDFNFSQFGYGA